MNSYITLTKAFMTGLDSEKPKQKSRKLLLLVLGILAIFGLFLPVTLGVGILVHLMTTSLAGVGKESMGAMLVCFIICVFTVVFGMSVIMNEFYFSGDIEFLLPWPLKARQIVAAKFTSVFLNENAMQISLVIACVVGYGLAAKIGPLQWILSVIGIFTLPMIPLAYCGILGILIMGTTRWIKSKDVIQHLSVAITLIFLLIFLSGIGFLQDVDIDTYVVKLATGDQAGIKALSLVFPHVPLFIKTISQGSLLALLQYLLLQVLVLAFLLLLADVLYFKGVIGLTSASHRELKEESQKLIERCKKHSPAYAYFKKEVRMLTRTPVFFTNCVAVNFLWPLFVYGAIKISHLKFSLLYLQTLYELRDLRIQLFFLLGSVGIPVLVTALNSISSNAFSREGKQFVFMKYIPVSYKTQWKVKVLVGMLYPLFGVLLFLIPACILVHAPVSHIILFSLLTILSVTFVSMMGVYIDSVQPKLTWDDEMTALRGNYNAFFSMAMAMLFAVILCVGGFVLFCISEISITLTAVLMITILLLANEVIYGLTKRNGILNLFEMEDGFLKHRN